MVEKKAADSSLQAYVVLVYSVVLTVDVLLLKKSICVLNTRLLCFAR